MSRDNKIQNEDVRLLTPNEVAAVLQVPVKTLYG
jgi:hypothetical protein